MGSIFGSSMIVDGVGGWDVGEVEDVEVGGRLARFGGGVDEGGG